MDVNREKLVAMDCWFQSDRVSHRPDITEFKRTARLHQAAWRIRRNLPIGEHSRGGKGYPNGSKIASLDEHRSANFLSPQISEAVEARVGASEPFQTLDETRLRFDLLSSMPLCFNLFGELHDNASHASTAASKLWGCDPEEPAEIRFEWSPGRRDPRYLNDRTAFDAAVIVGSSNAPRTIIGIETKYHEHATVESMPDPVARLPRYRAVTEASGIFAHDWDTRILGTELQQIWRDHLLLLSMLQQPDEWRSGLYVLVFPARNPAFREAGERYREVLTDDSTFQARTIEDLLDAGVLHAPATETRFRERYCW